MTNKWKKIKEKIIRTGYRALINRTFELPDGRVVDYAIKKEGLVVCMFVLTDKNEVVLFK